MAVSTVPMGDVIDVGSTNLPSTIAPTASISIIESDEQLLIADELIGKWRAYRDSRVAKYAPSKKKAYDAHKQICEDERKELAQIDAEIAKIDGAMVAYNKLVQQRIDDERKKLEAEAEQKARDDRKAEVKALRKEGRADEAEALKAAPVERPPVAAPSFGLPSLTNTKFRKRYVAAVANEMEFLIAMMKPPVYRYAAEALRRQAAKPENKKDRDAIKRVAAFLERGANELQQIPVEAVEIREGWITTEANRREGNLKWPGILITEDEKTGKKGGRR